MVYEDIYNGLSDEEKERMIKADIPKFEVVGEIERTEEDKKKSRTKLFEMIDKFKQSD